MGVHGLESLIKAKIPNGFKNVSITQEIDEFKRKKYQKPICIFDCCSIIGYLMGNSSESKLNILCGGTFDFYYYELSKLFSQFSHLCELVFFLDGFISKHKYNTWASRQDDKYIDCMKIMEKIYEGVSIKEIADRHNFFVNTTLSVIEHIAKQYGTLNYAVNKECDQEIAQFATKNSRVLGVFSDDSDFLIFGGRWRYFSMKFLNPYTFNTKEYNRVALRTYLNLTDFQLSLWATCLGNDIIPLKQVRHFHVSLRCDKFLKIAEIVRDISKQSYKEILISLALKLIGFIDEYGLNLIDGSIKQYAVHYKNKDETNDYDYLLYDHIIFTRNVLSDAPFNFSLVFFNLDIYNSPTYFDIAVQMFQRQTGIVFAQANIDPFNLKVYSKRSNADKHSIYEISPILPDFDVLPMKKIHSNNNSYDDHRFKLLAWSICWRKLKNFNLQLIPPRYLIDVLSLVYLLELSVITPNEADIILLSIKNVEQGKVQVNRKNKLIILDKRAFHIAFLFTKMFTNVARSIEICGLRKRYGKPLNFNGVEFHLLFNRYKYEKFDTNSLLNDI